MPPNQLVAFQHRITSRLVSTCDSFASFVKWITPPTCLATPRRLPHAAAVTILRFHPLWVFPSFCLSVFSAFAFQYILFFHSFHFIFLVFFCAFSIQISNEVLFSEIVVALFLLLLLLLLDFIFLSMHVKFYCNCYARIFAASRGFYI